MSLGVVIFIVAILTVVMIHEAGHFVMAKLFHFKATKFFLGFGPTLWSFQKGETEYGLKAIPAGGFVKIVGMNPYEEIPPEDAPRSYPNKPRWQRALVLVAGSATHWVVAFAILAIAAMTIGFPTGRATNQVEEVTPTFDGVTTPAAKIGLKPGERIISVGGEVTDDWDFIRNYIRDHGGEEAVFLIASDEEGEQTRIASVKLGWIVYDRDGAPIRYIPPGEPRPEMETGQSAAGFLGVQPELEFKTESFGAALATSGRITADITRRSVIGIKDVFSMVFGGRLWSALTGEGERQIDEGPVGLIGAGRIAGESVQRGHYLDLVGLIVAFTVFVGLMNLLPLPPLDGGHLAVLGYEALTGRTVDVRKLIPIAAAVISFFALLFIAVLYLDLARPIQTPF